MAIDRKTGHALCWMMILLTGSIFSSCNTSSAKQTRANRVVAIQPFSDIPAPLVEKLYKQLLTITPRIVLKPAVVLPASAYYAPRNRYRADSLLHFLGRRGSADTVVIGLTGKDISTTKGNVADWGVMGLGYRPGNACVVSLFRLSKTERGSQFYKVAIHELGHTQGLPHCPDPACFMRDAEGGNPLNEEKDFCKSCKTFLQSKGWQLH